MSVARSDDDRLGLGGGVVGEQLGEEEAGFDDRGWMHPEDTTRTHHKHVRL